ncbi:hypothetical protein [Oceanimonas baumannii]|uniref:Uncharacterized protein n=1 Tax=Oceanimonas baumannii TaxID=129578 RepID=A0A235CL10_9GAMM|nr:hypothetical protein [Oceanimonas baumannii]OYD24717.1 hypothetical protein B6S09_08830 [Oceanimonas baumannii]TDW59464.1 hypothetical protein LY04_01715 [Oceanimonas baumannii]
MTAYREITQSAGELAINNMRDMVGCTRIASWWNGLTKSSREGLCRTAALKPAVYWNKALEEMSDDEREAIRRAVVELKSALASFAATDRSEWLHVADYPGQRHDEPAMTAQQQAKRQEYLEQQALMIQRKAEMVKAAQL